MSYLKKRFEERKRDVDHLERTFRVNRQGDIWFFDKKHKAVKTIAGRELPSKIASLFYDILASER